MGNIRTVSFKFSKNNDCERINCASLEVICECPALRKLRIVEESCLLHFRGLMFNQKIYVGTLYVVLKWEIILNFSARKLLTTNEDAN
jgi:hypothetical protein